MFEVALIAGIVFLAISSLLRVRETMILRREMEQSNLLLEGVLTTLRDRL